MSFKFKKIHKNNTSLKDISIEKYFTKKPVFSNFHQCDFPNF